MADDEVQWDYALSGFQVGLASGVVAVRLNLRCPEAEEGAQVIVALSAAMAETLSTHLREASVAAALGPVPTPVRQ